MAFGLTSCGFDEHPASAPHPAGEAWIVEASGESLGLHWTILSTKATAKGFCGSIELEPAPSEEFDTPLPGEEVYESRRTGCVSQPDRHAPVRFPWSYRGAGSDYGFAFGVVSSSVMRVEAVGSEGVRVVSSTDALPFFLVIIPAGGELDSVTLDTKQESTRCSVSWTEGVAAGDDCDEVSS
jgi:hypothetical protein